MYFDEMYELLTFYGHCSHAFYTNPSIYYNKKVDLLS